MRRRFCCGQLAASRRPHGYRDCPGFKAVGLAILLHWQWPFVIVGFRLTVGNGRDTIRV